MNPELLTCRHLTAGLIYPPVTAQPPDMNRLYVQVTERYPYQSLQHLPDGIRMANPNGDCFVQLGRTQINESLMYFQASKEKCLDIFRMVQEKFRIPQFMTFGLKLTAALPLSSPGEAAQMLQNKAFSISNSQWDLLGHGRQGAGIRVVLHQDGVYDLRIEPLFSNPSELFIELDVQHPQPFSRMEDIGPKMDAVYDYMFGNVKEFIGAL